MEEMKFILSQLCPQEEAAEMIAVIKYLLTYSIIHNPTRSLVI